MADIAAAFVGLIRRAAAGKPFSRLARCPKCNATRKFVVAAETGTTAESIYRCEACGLAVTLD